MKNGARALSVNDETEVSLRSCVENEPVGIGVIYGQYNDRLVAFLRGKLNKSEDPQDIAHDVFVRLVEMGDVPDGAHLENLIFRIARTMVIDIYRKQRVRQLYLRENMDGGGQANDDPLQDQVLSGKQDWLRFRNCLNGLPPKCRKIFILHRVHRYSQKQIAAQLGISVSAIEKNMIRAVMKLKKGLENKL